MKKSELVVVLLSIFTMIAFSDTTAYAEYHHVADCMVCHDMHHGGVECDNEYGQYTNLCLVRCEISTPSSGGKLVKFTCDFSEEFPCGPEDNSYADGDDTYNGVCEVCHTSTDHHRNDGSDNTEHFDGQDCIACHPHWNQFTEVLPYEQAHDTHLTADKGPKIGCSDCHSDPILFNPTIFADDLEFGDTHVCDICHSPDGAYDGINDPAIGAKPNWVDAVYEETGDILKAGKENWCAGCHDDGTSIIEGVSAPNVMGNDIDYGYNRSGHGRNPQNYVNCSDCHDLTVMHTDAMARTYESSQENYKDGYRLKYSMDIPRKTDDYGAEVFELCFKCHTYGDIFDDTPPFNTNFRDDDKTENYHRFHLYQYWFDYWDSDWDGVLDSSGSCTACHNVHGSPTVVMTRHGELISTPGPDPPDKVPALDFKWYKSDGETITTVLAESRYGSLLCGGPGNLSTNNVCVGCHPTESLTYYRFPAVEEGVEVKKVWTTDLSDNEKTDFAPGEDIRYRVKFTITGPGSYYVKAIGKAFNISGEDWETEFRRKKTLSEGIYHWKWDKTIPSYATTGSTAKVKIKVKMFDAPGGSLLSKDMKSKKFHIVAP